MTTKEYIDTMESIARFLQKNIEDQYESESGRAWDINIGIRIMVEKIKESDFLLERINK